MKKTKIVATIGPVSDEFEQIKALADNGVNVFRLNFSHGSHEYHGNIIKKIRRLNQKSLDNYAILLDTKGPEIRTSDIKEPIDLKKGDKLILTIEHTTYEESGRIQVNYDDFINDVEVNEKILIDNGVMNLKVLEKTDKNIICEVLDGGELGSRRHLNLPGKDVSLESITKKDWDDIKFGLEMGVDFIALSFVRRANEILELKEFLEKEKKGHIDVIAKIESFEATKHLETITQASDGLMVARGDLGAEISFAQVPSVQIRMIELAAIYQKPVIVATHMLESMIVNPIPTRAEVSDVFNAIRQSSDAIMLSGETASGKYPIKSVKTMSDIAYEAEKELLPRSELRLVKVNSSRGEFAHSAARIASDLDSIKAILVITRSGMMARLVAGFRPKVPIYAFTNEPQSRRKVQLLWGVKGFRIDFSATPEKTINRAISELLKKESSSSGTEILIVSDMLVDKEFIPTLQVRKI